MTRINKTLIDLSRIKPLAF